MLAEPAIPAVRDISLNGQKGVFSANVIQMQSVNELLSVW